MNAQNKLDAVRAALAGTKVDYDQFLKKLATLCDLERPEDLTDEHLRDARFEEIEDCGTARITARRIARIFRGDEETTKAQKVVIDVSSDPQKHAATLSPVQLVKHYDADNHTNPYGQRLKEVTENRRCIAFNKDGSLNVDMSKTLIDEIVNLQYPERDSVVVDGIPSPIFKVGQRPDRFADENPADPGKPLRPDGRSDCGCDWGLIDLTIRQLVHLAVTIGETNDEELDIYDRIEGKTFAQIAQRYRKASVLFQEKEELGTLPQLKIRLGKDGHVRKNNPFEGGNRVW